MKISIYTLGCKVNQYETAAMERARMGAFSRTACSTRSRNFIRSPVPEMRSTSSVLISSGFVWA